MTYGWRPEISAWEEQLRKGRGAPFHEAIKDCSMCHGTGFLPQSTGEQIYCGCKYAPHGRRPVFELQKEGAITTE